MILELFLDYTSFITVRITYLIACNAIVIVRDGAYLYACADNKNEPKAAYTNKKGSTKSVVHIYDNFVKSKLLYCNVNAKLVVFRCKGTKENKAIN